MPVKPITRLLPTVVARHMPHRLPVAGSLAVTAIVMASLTAGSASAALTRPGTTEVSPAAARPW
jgi:hypothetical protein